MSTVPTMDVPAAGRAVRRTVALAIAAAAAALMAVGGMTAASSHVATLHTLADNGVISANDNGVINADDGGVIHANDGGVISTDDNGVINSN